MHFVYPKVYKLFLNQLLHLKMKRIHKKFSANKNKASSHTAHISWSHVVADPVWLPAPSEVCPGLHLAFSLPSGLLPSFTSLVCSLYTSEFLTPDLTRLQEGSSQDSRLQMRNLQPASMRTDAKQAEKDSSLLPTYFIPCWLSLWLDPSCCAFATPWRDSGIRLVVQNEPLLTAVQYYTTHILIAYCTMMF